MTDHPVPTTTGDSPVPPSGGETLSRGKKLLFSLVLAALVLGVGEAASIWYLRAFRGYDGRHLYQYAFDPYKNILPTPGYVDTRGIRHNRAGFRRSTEVAHAKPAGTFRVFLLGGSTAYGLGGLWPHLDRSHPVLTNSETIDAYLERQLAPLLPGRTVEVINAAITSTWTHHNLIYLNQTILTYDPDLVLFLDGYNDFFQTEPWHDQFASYNYNMPGRIILGDPSLHALAYGAGWWAFRKVALVHVLGRGLRVAKQLVTPKAVQRPMDVDTALYWLHRNFPANALTMQRRIGLILRDAGIPAVFMLQPMLVLERDRAGQTDLERRMWQFNVTSYLPRYEQFIRAAVPWVAEQEGRMARDVGATFIDLTTAFRGVPADVYTDYAHLTPLGNQVVAETIVARIRPLIDARSIGPAASGR